MLHGNTVRRKWHFAVFALTFIIMGSVFLFKNKNNALFTSVLLKTASFLPLSVQFSIEKRNLCQEDSKGVPIPIQMNDILPVFKRDGSRQCEEGTEIPIKEMEKELKKLGIKTFKSVKGHLVKGRGLSVCGSPTSNINIFYISSNKKQKALSVGFHSCIEDN